MVGGKLFADSVTSPLIMISGAGIAGTVNDNRNIRKVNFNF